MQKQKPIKWPISMSLLLGDYKMGNQLFQEARRFVEMAKSASTNDRQSAMEKAKNALSSAYANSTIAEQSQLHKMQDELDQLNS
jgi:polyhydroxyalkanoate synthesis regulator phasin